MSTTGTIHSVTAPEAPVAGFDVHRIRKDFPILGQEVYGKPLVYLDNAATTQKPQVVLDALRRFYETECANVHRGIHKLSEDATDDYEGARLKAQKFLRAADSREIVFTRGTTDAINLVAWSFGRKFVEAGDEILITAMEHHSNIVPWQMVCAERGAQLRVAPVNEDGELVLDELEKLLTPHTRLLALSHMSNVLGTINPVAQIIQMAHRRNVPVLLDGAQAAPHLPVNVQELDCDFYAFSGHKIFGPTGVGVLYGKARWLEQMPPYQGGGDMIRSVSFEKTEYNTLPYKFEAGTPHIAGVIGLGAALDYVSQVGLNRIAAYENELLEHATRKLSKVPGLRIIGTSRNKGSVISFVMEEAHAHDVGTILDREAIAVRSGHHCAMPLMDRFGIPATTRASFAFYNTREEVDALVAGIEKVREVFA